MPVATGFRILGSAMSAQRTRLHLTASNLANAATTRTPDGGPYKRKDPVFSAEAINEARPEDGLSKVVVDEILVDETEGPLKYDPDHPDADADGNVRMPNVNVVEETVNMVTASRSFEANVQAFQTLRDMVSKALEIGR